ncbi:MAG: PhoH family protein [Alphaproteobacteria bacterium]|nr:PhoH family protein [Alphaproteobacteria bacterium]
MSTRNEAQSPEPLAGPLQVKFDDNRLLTALFGPHDEHLVQIERLVDVKLRYRGNELKITGPAQCQAIAEQSIGALYERLRHGLDVGPAEVKAAVRMAVSGNVEAVTADGTTIRTRKRVISPRSPNQLRYMEALGRDEMVFGLGPAGTGKTYLAVAKAVSMLLRGDVERIILSRPAVEAGERLGFLPGDIREKVDPYLRPLYDALYDMLPAEQVAGRISAGEIQIAPLAFMRGRTLDNAFIILDEAQNTSPMQMKMFLTRLGEGATMAVTGDMSQIDLGPGMKSGLVDCLEILRGIKGMSVVEFEAKDVVRHPMVTRIVRAYNSRDEQATAKRAHAKRENRREPDKTKRAEAD